MEPKPAPKPMLEELSPLSRGWEGSFVCHVAIEAMKVLLQQSKESNMVIAHKAWELARSMEWELVSYVDAKDTASKRP